MSQSLGCWTLWVWTLLEISGKGSSWHIHSPSAVHALPQCAITGTQNKGCCWTYAASWRQGVPRRPAQCCLHSFGIFKLGSAGDLTFTKSAVDKSLYNLSDFFLIQAEKPLFFCFSSLGFVLYSSSVRTASVSGQIMHLLGQDVTSGWDNKHLISEKLMITGSLLTFQLSPSAMSAFSDAPTSLICKLLGCSVGSGWGHPWMESQAREEMAAITVRDTSLTGVNGQRWSSLSGEQKLFSFSPPSLQLGEGDGSRLGAGGGRVCCSDLCQLEL